MPHPCPLCATPDASLLCEGRVPPREYYRCGTCRLTFVAPETFVPPAEEKLRYEQHNNVPDDPQYRAFLRPVFDAIRSRVAPAASGLDYGCGPGPALVAMLREAGLAAEGYDPFFAPQADLLLRQYDFITCTEAAEHFHEPAREFERLAGLLKPGGWLAILTQAWNEATAFPEWYYARDPTHVMFFHDRSFRWLAERHGWRLAEAGKSLFVFESAKP